MKKIIIVSTTNYIFKEIKKSNKINTRIYFIKKKKELNLKKILKIQPDLIFFVQWHWKINRILHEKYKCIGFHETPLPYGRGGTPIQNMILRGFTKTRVCALKIVDKFDQGPIYMSKSISLKGKGQEIMIRINRIIFSMIIKLTKKLPSPLAQKGKAVYFKRREPSMSELPKNLNNKKIFNFIRMLDIEEKNFPRAHILYGKNKIILSNASFEEKKIKFEGFIE
jgi:methionyl-tRNA formyltransferase